MTDSFETRLESGLRARAEAAVASFDSAAITERAATAHGRHPPGVAQVLLAAAVVALAVIVGGLAASRLVGTKPTPMPSSTSSPSAPGTTPPPATGTLQLSSRYRSVGFGEPFSFEATRALFGRIGVSTPGGWGGFRGLDFRGFGWDIFVLDDVPVHADYCDASGPTLPDIPASPAKVGRWLKGSTGMSVSGPVEVEVDGRTALRFDLETGRRCEDFEPPLTAPEFTAMRIYAVPTGDDTILVGMWGDPGSWPAMDRYGDAWVSSFDFDE
jgi:hypothetical protein